MMGIQDAHEASDWFVLLAAWLAVAVRWFRGVLRFLFWPAGANKLRFLPVATVLLESGIFYWYHRITDGYGTKSIPPPARSQADVFERILTASPGLRNPDELYALQVLTLALMYHFFDRLKLWEKFSSRLLIENFSKFTNLVILALLEVVGMVGFMLFMAFVVFPGIPLWNLLFYIYMSLQCTKATAEAVQRFTPQDQGLDVALCIGIICHSLVVGGVIFVLPLFPSLIEEIGLFYGIWANVALIYLVVSLCEPVAAGADVADAGANVAG